MAKTEDPLALSMAIAAKNLNSAIIEAMKNGLVVKVEIIINQTTFDGYPTCSHVPKIIMQVFRNLTVDLQ